MQTHFLFDVLDGYKPFEQMAQESQNSGAVIAASGITSRRKAEQYIVEGRVKVNGEVCTMRGKKIRSGDTVAVEGYEVTVL